MSRTMATLVGASLSAAVLRGCKPKLYRAGSSSMAPTITNGQAVVADLFSYQLSSPKRWDAVVFRSPVNPTQTWLMRVVGLPGESVSFATGGITLNGKAVSLPAELTNVSYVSLDRVHGGLRSSLPSPYNIPAACYFLLGDNSSNAYDGRFWGATSRSNILGRVIYK
jgi:signal peptidase I